MARRGGSLQQAGRYREAMALVARRGSRKTMSDVDALQALAAALLAQGRTAEGLASPRQGRCARAATTRSMHETLGRVQRDGRPHRRRDSELSAGARAATRISAAAADALVRCSRRPARYDEAEDRSRDALAKIGDSARRRHALAGALFEQGRVDEAIVELQAPRSRSTRDAPHVESELVRALNYVGRSATRCSKRIARGGGGTPSR